MSSTHKSVLYTYVYVYICINVAMMYQMLFSGMSRNKTANAVLNIEDYDVIRNNMFSTKLLISPCSYTQVWSLPISVKSKPFLSSLLSQKPWFCP